MNASSATAIIVPKRVKFTNSAVSSSVSLETIADILWENLDSETSNPSNIAFNELSSGGSGSWTELSNGSSTTYNDLGNP